MNRRQLQIFDRLMADSEFYSVDRLATIFKKSKRTIYGDISDISEFFQAYDTELFSIDAKGVIEKKQNSLEREVLLGKIDFYSYELNAEERTYLIIYILLFSNRPITINYISELLFCSRATIVKDMNDAKKVVEGLGSHINLYQNKGYVLMGEEIKLRELFLAIFERDSFLLQLFYQSAEMFIHSKSELELIRKMTVHECVRKHLMISDSSQVMLENYLYFARWRIDFGKVILQAPEAEDYHELAINIVHHLFIRDSESLEGEIQYLMVLIKQLKVISKNKTEHSLVTVHLLVRVFIEEMSDSLSVLLSNDTELFTNLSNHMFDILEKKYQQQQKSDELLIFMEKNHHLVSRIREKADVFENYINRKLSETELGFLALHLQASIEKESRRELKLNALLVCNSGVGTSQLLKTQLKNIYGFNFLLPVSATELQEYDFGIVDLVISTVDLKMELPIPIVKISFNITHSDLSRIDQVIKNIPAKEKSDAHTWRPAADQLLSKLYPLVIEHDHLLEDIRIVVEHYFMQQAAQQEYSLRDLLKPEMILLDAVAESGEDAIRQGAALLENKGYVSTDFAEAIIDSIHAYGPYMLIDQDVLFPHAGFDHGAMITGFSFIRLKTPVSFKADKSDQVDLLFTLSASDNQLHVNALFSLLECLSNEQFKAEIRRAAVPEEIVEIIKKFEQ